MTDIQVKFTLEEIELISDQCHHDLNQCDFDQQDEEFQEKVKSIYKKCIKVLIKKQKETPVTISNPNTKECNMIIRIRGRFYHLNNIQVSFCVFNIHINDRSGQRIKTFHTNSDERVKSLEKLFISAIINNLPFMDFGDDFESSY